MGVTLEQFKEWLEKNKHLTWHHKNWGKSDCHTIVKYFDIGFDCRTMDIFTIQMRGSLEDFRVHEADCKKGETILDLLDKRLKEILDKTS